MKKNIDENVNIDEIWESIPMHLLSEDVGGDLLKQGYSIVYREKDTPIGCVLREYPNGRIELVKVDMYGNNDEIIQVIKDGK
jgi:hypothetical protein